MRIPPAIDEQDFKKLTQGFAGRPTHLPIAQTAEAHLNGMVGARIGLTGREQPMPYETAPDGNAVILEEQTAKAGKTALDHQLASNIYRKYVGMIKIALGSNGGG